MTKEFITPREKEVQIKTNTYGHYYVEFKQGGRLPKELDGTWTSLPKVEAVVQRYIDTRPQARQGGKTKED